MLLITLTLTMLCLILSLSHWIGAVSQIFSVKELRDLENWVRGCSRSRKMAPFNRPYTTFYWSAIVNIALWD